MSYQRHVAKALAGKPIPYALLDAVESMLIGGNHLASLLINRIGPDFPERFTDRESALEKMDGETYDIWCAWRSCMDLAGEVGKALRP